MHDLYTAEIYTPRAIFLPQIVWVYNVMYLDSFLQRATEKARVLWCVTVIQGHLRSSKKVPIESPCMRLPI